MKTCPGCKETKELIAFAHNKAKKDGYQTYCKLCKVAQDKLYYSTNKESHKKRVQQYWNENRQRLWQYLLEHPCVDCGITNPIVLEFDHLRDKIGSISNLLNIQKYSWKALEKEISKCEVRCANCHRIKTAQQFSWYTFLGR